MLMRHWLPLVLLSTAAYSAPQTLCTSGVTSFPIFSVLATTGFVGDFTLSCVNTGFAPGSSTGLLNFGFFLSAPQLNIGPWTLTDGTNNYAGLFVPVSEHIQFTSVLYDPNIPLINFELSGVEVNPSLNPPGYLYLESIGISGSISVPIQNPTIGVAQNAPEPTTMPLAAVAAVIGGMIFRRRRAR
jgi:hypothetical protein